MFSRIGALLQRLGRGKPAEVWPETEQLPATELPDAAEQAPVTLGGYPLERTVARGALGVLHLARHPLTREPVAIKTIRFEGRELSHERFLLECEAARRLNHPDIVRTLSAGVVQGPVSHWGWLAMEWVPAGNLLRYTSPGHLLPEPLVLGLVARLADALEHAHGCGVMHRDIKPSNVLFDPVRSVVKLADFGCAHLTDAERTRSGLLLGAPAYLAPEQLCGAHPSPAVDLYALGVLLFELLCGRLPFGQTSLGELLGAVANQAAPQVQQYKPELPDALNTLVADLLDKQPQNRPQSAADLATTLREIQQTWGGIESPRHALAAQNA